MKIINLKKLQYFIKINLNKIMKQFKINYNLLIY